MADELAPKVAPRPGSRGRRFIATGLLFATYLLGIAAVCSQIPIYLAASRVINTGNGSFGPNRLLLPDFSIASFDGIIPADDGKSYLVTMHMSLTSFSWEYPSSPNKAQSAGLVSPTYDNSLYLPRDFVPIGKALGLDPSAWACFPPAWAQTCENPFFAAFRKQWPFDSPPGLLSRSIFILSFAVAGTILVIELLIAVRPHWLRCRCYFSVLKRICPCPRGERHEIERLPPSFWDRYRLWWWPLLPCYVALEAFDLAARGWLLLSWLERTADGGAAAMRPRMGRGFVAANWAGVACALAATACVLVRFLLSRRVNWMEQQGASAIVDSEAATSVGLDDGPATVDHGRPRGYTDAPDAPIAPKVADRAGDS